MNEPEALAPEGSLLPDGVTVKVYEPAGSARNVHVCVPVGAVVVFATVHVVVAADDVTV